jgi:threonine/homoserine/homoserine lactone efflux protein
LSPMMAYGTAVAFNAINPMSLVLMLALLSPIIGVSGSSSAQAAALLLGVFTAVVTWWICLASGVNLLRSRLSPEMLLVVNQIAGIGLTIYGTAALVRSAGL